MHEYITRGLAAVVILAGATPAFAQKVDIKAAEAAILQADRDFNRAVAEGSRERFGALIAQTATFNGGTPGEARARGNREIMGAVLCKRRASPQLGANQRSCAGGWRRWRDDWLVDSENDRPQRQER
jgi:hypothetical protein